jgi:hypothetical protein
LAIDPVGQPTVAARTSGQPIDEVLRLGAVQVADADLAVEVGQREADQQPAVLPARVRADAVVARSGVAIKPREAEPVQRRTAAQRPCLARARCSLIA